MRRAAATIAILGVGLAAAACEDHEFEPPDRAERVEEAGRMYSPALFDTVSWSTRAERIRDGNLVYADHCRRCHGPLGRGDTEYARAQELDVPSLVAPDWEHADDFEAVRRRVFTGHALDMPTWGIGRLTPRQIDAATYYVVEQLRVEVNDTTRIPGGDA